MSTRIVLVRHAQSVLPRLGEPDDDQRPLAPAGLAAAEALVDRLAAYAPAAVLSSPLLRAVQTVRPAADALGLAVTTWPSLREWESGLVPSADWETPYAYSWAHPGFAHGAGESLDAVTVRAGKALARMGEEYPDATVLVGSHGTFLTRALIASGQWADWEFCRAMPMPAIYEVTV
ncbi:histidine phosphatase family protein [Lentzea sp. BCCO 10_0061]|uniref:Histidine phosphatase family protein n=1 Tax=Lentzea sokolovensis TaxID=3095429 RepID=A0ABU4V2W0_9PSEU|nr:histidine phosphatase family protein [Lentzea sp. BCCO 10_0061]MDX8145667.1 histidine phosphatase family protein [Lentzea sp. BCCO 10_0061]